MTTAAVAEHGPTGIVGVRTSAGYTPWPDFTAQAVLAITTRLHLYAREQSRPEHVIAREQVQRQIIAARHCCDKCGCLLLGAEPCIGCSVRS